MPLSVQRSVRKQNIRFLHNRILFSPEYFLFIKKLVQCNALQSPNLVQRLQNEEDNSLEDVMILNFKLLCIILCS